MTDWKEEIIRKVIKGQFTLIQRKRVKEALDLAEQRFNKERLDIAVKVKKLMEEIASLRAELKAKEKEIEDWKKLKEYWETETRLKIKEHAKQLGEIPDRIFHDHIKAHFEKEHPDWKVICKICGKTYEEIIKSKLNSKGAGKEK